MDEDEGLLFSGPIFAWNTMAAHTCTSHSCMLEQMRKSFNGRLRQHVRRSNVKAMIQTQRLVMKTMCVSVYTMVFNQIPKTLMWTGLFTAL